MTKKTIETYCNESCNKPFTIKQMKTAKLPGGIEKTCFICPHCQHEYLCFYTDKAIRKLQASMRALHRKMKWADDAQLNQLKKEEATLKDSIADCMSNLKQRFHGNE